MSEITLPPLKQEDGQYAPEVVQHMVKASLALDEEKLYTGITKYGNLVQRFVGVQTQGQENIPEGPVLFVANHSIFAMDVFVLLPALNKAANRVVRGMNHELLYRNPRVRDWALSIGLVMGHRDIGDVLFANGKSLLLYPGGAHEANKRESERYNIMWKERLGFVHMAAKHGVPIVPVGIVGPDEWYGLYMDRHEMADSRLGSLLIKAGLPKEILASDKMIPVPKGMLGLPTLLPRPQKVYISIGKPVSTSEYQGQQLEKKAAWKLREQVRTRIEKSIAEMLLLQAQEKDKVGFIRRLLMT